MRATSISIALFGAAIATPCLAEPAPNWQVSEFDFGCGASAEFGDDTRLTFGTDRAMQTSFVTLWNSKWKSIQEGKKYSLRLTFDGQSFDIAAEGTVIATGKRYAVMAFNADIHVLAAFSLGRTVSIWRDNNLVGLYPLAGSSKAAEAVARCVGRQAVRSKTDPFAG